MEEIAPAKAVELVVIKGTSRQKREVLSINRLDTIQKAASICVKEQGVRSVEIRDTWNRIPYTVTLRASEVQYARLHYIQEKRKAAELAAKEQEQEG